MYADIRGLSEAPGPKQPWRYSPPDGAYSRSGQDRANAGENVWRSQFFPAIVETAAGLAGRRELWYVLRYDPSKERVVTRLLDLIGQRYHLFLYEQRVPRSKPVLRPWLPGGYAFVSFDAARDRWQQVYGFPGVRGILGGPTPLPEDGRGSFDDLALRCPRRLPKPEALSALAPGTRVRVTEGPCAGQEGVVNRSTRQDAWFVGMMFGGFVEVRVALAHVKVVG